MTNQKQFPRALVLYPTRRGIAFVLFSAPLLLHDWGTKRTSGATKNADGLHAAKKLIDLHQPDIVVMEAMEAPGARRADRIRALNDAIAAYAEERDIETVTYSRDAIKAAFAEVGASTKHELNCAIVRLIPALQVWQPRKRRAWDAEHPAQGLFDAVAFGLTYFADIGRLDIAQALRDDNAPPLSLHSVRSPYLVPPPLPTLAMCA